MEAGDTIRTRLYTRTGDRGTTGLAGGSRIEKDSARIRAFGTFDELDAVLGVVLTTLGPAPSNVRTLLVRLQHELFVAQSELAAPAGAKPPAHRIEERHVRRLENEIDEFSATFEPIQTFVLPGGGAVGANLHFARTVARRAERELWTLDRESPQRPEILQWTNRLNDLLFALALSMNRREAIPEIPPDYTV